jgi:hypothetical protein
MVCSADHAANIYATLGLSLVFVLKKKGPPILSLDLYRLELVPC